MDYSIINQTLEFWCQNVNGTIEDQRLYFDNENGKGEIKGYQFDDKFHIMVFDFMLKKKVHFKTSSLINLPFVNISFSNPGHVRNLSGESVVRNKLYQSFGIISIHLDGDLEWTYTQNIEHKFVAIRVDKKYFKTLIDQYESTKILFNLEREFLIFEDLDPHLRWFTTEIINIKGDNTYDLDRIYNISSGLLIQFMIKVARRKVKKRKDDDQKNLIQPILETYQILEQNIKQQVSIEEICKEVGLSESRLRVLFKEAFGESIYSYHLKLRLTKSQEVLLQTDKTMSQIAMDFGFSSSAHFSQAFKKYFKQTPKQFKNSNR